MKKTVKTILALCCTIFLTCISVHAAELTSVMNVYTCPDSVVLFMKNQGQEIDNVYLGNDEAKRFQEEEAGPVRTVVVLDNSLSIDEKYRDDIKTFLIDLVAARNDGDMFTIATFEKELNYLVRESNDYLYIKEQIEALQFEDQVSYFTNVMYTVMNDISAYENIMYTRMIVIADGVDNEALGYTDDELNSKIHSVQIPVYTLGCSSEGNEENLKKMFALSRMSNGKSYLLDDIPVNQVLQDIAADTDVVKLTVMPQDKSCDGTSKPVRISFGQDYCVTEASMPFKAAVEPISQETKTEPETAIETEAQVSEPESEFPVVLFGILGALAVIIVIAVVMLARKKKPKEEEEQPDLSVIGHSQKTFIKKRQNDSERKTEILHSGNQGPQKNATNILGGASGIKLILQDMDHPSKKFECLLRDRILIGRDGTRCQVVIDYNDYVSGIHCEVVTKGNSLYVRDGGEDVIVSTNGTFVNDKKVAPELPLPSGAVLKLGEVKLKVTYSEV